MTDAYEAPPMLPVTPLPEEQFAQVCVYYVCTMYVVQCVLQCVLQCVSQV